MRTGNAKMWPGKVLSDQEIQEAWAAWESPEQIKEFLMDWIDMTYAEKLAFFYGMVLPQRCGKRAYLETLGRIQSLALVSRYPTKPDHPATLT